MMASSAVPGNTDPIANVEVSENLKPVEVFDLTNVVGAILGINPSPKDDNTESIKPCLKNISTQSNQLCLKDDSTRSNQPCVESSEPCQDAAGVESSEPCQDAKGVESSKLSQDAKGVESGKPCPEIEREEIQSSREYDSPASSEPSLFPSVINRGSPDGKIIGRLVISDDSRQGLSAEPYHFFDNCYTACLMTLENFSQRKTKKEQITSSEFKFACNTWKMQAEFRETFHENENEEALIVSLMKITDNKIDAELKVRSSLIDKNGSKQRIVCDDVSSSLLPLSDITSAFTRKGSNISSAFAPKESYMGLFIIAKSVLLDKFHEDLVSNDCLIICVELFMEDAFPCDITWNNGPENLPLESHPYVANLSSNLSTLLETGEYADIILKAGDIEIPAHKLILSSRSKVFAKKLEENLDEKYLIIYDVESSDIMPLLKYIYSSVVPDLSLESVCRLYETANKYALAELKDWCKQQIVARLSEDNLYLILLFVEKCKDCELKNMLIEYFLFNIGLFLNKKWLTFCGEYPTLSIEILNEFTVKSVTTGLTESEWPSVKPKDEEMECD